MKKTCFTLSLRDYRVGVYLGCTEKERQKKQSVCFDVTFSFKKMPQACLTDDLASTYCYAEISAVIKSMATQKPYKLIEHLGYAVFKVLQKKLQKGDGLKLQLTKLRPPIKHLKGGAVFSCENT